MIEARRDMVNTVFGVLNAQGARTVGNTFVQIRSRNWKNQAKKSYWVKTLSFKSKGAEEKPVWRFGKIFVGGKG